MTRRAGPRARGGFTLVELLIVVVIVGILAAVAIPRFSSSKTKAFDSAARNDLKNAMSAQEAYYANRLTYTTLNRLALTTSAGVRLGGGGSARGYSMTSRHQRSTKTFRVVVGGGTSTQGKIQ